MRKVKFLIYPLLFLLLPSYPAFSYKIFYAEQWYKLYHQHLHRYAEDEWQNLMFLEEALKAPFASPLYALAKVTTEEEWEQYCYLFKLHVNLQIVRTYIQMATKYDRQNVYFFNQPFKDQNLKSLAIAELYYKRALYFWQEALTWVPKANDERFRWTELEEITNWQEELRAINNESLNFEIIITKHLGTLSANRQALEELP